MPQTFPWLATTASAYESYKFRSLKFVYAGRVSSTVGGYCTIAVDFDPSDPAPTSRQEINNFNDRTAVVPWTVQADLVCRRDGLSRIPKYLTRSSSVAGELGIYDVGTLYIVTGGQATSSAIGELWVEYDVEFYIPQTNRPGALVARNNAVYNYLNDITYTAPLTVPYSNTVYNPFGFINTAGVISGVAGVFTVYAQLLVQATTLTSGQLLINKNGTQIQNVIFPPLNSSNQASANIQVVTSLVASDQLNVTFSGAGSGIVLKTGVPPGSAVTFQLSPA